MASKMPIFGLPNELLIQVGKELEPRDLDCFIRTNRCLAILLTPVLHQIAVHTKVIEVGGGTVLTWAAVEGHLGLLNSLLDHGSDIEVTNNLGWTPLMLAAHKGQVAVIQLLLDRGANMMAQGPPGSGETVLHCAVLGGQAETARVLLKMGVGVDAKSGSGDTPLHSAVTHSHGDLVRLLLENGANIDDQNNSMETPLLLAVRGSDRSGRGLYNWAIQSEEHGADDPEKVLEEALRKVSEISNEAILRILVDKGANVHLMDRYDNCPLHYAAENGYTEMVKILLENGADITASDSRGCTALLRAAEGSYRHRYRGNDGHIAVIRLLLQNGADIYVEDGESKTIRQWGSSGNVLLCDFLEEMGQDVEDLRAYESSPDSCEEEEYDGCCVFTGLRGYGWEDDQSDESDESDEENEDDEENSWDGD